MKTLKQLIVRIFGIKPEDIQAQQQPSHVDDETKAIIQHEIKNYLDQALQKYIIPEIRKAVQESISNLDLDTSSKAKSQQHYDELSKIPPSELDLEFPEIIEDNTEQLSNLQEEKLSTTDDNIPAPGPVLYEEEVLPLDDGLVEIPETFQPVAIDWSESRKDIRLGVDFGTTTTAVSIKIGDERPIALPIGKDGMTPYIPSVAYFSPVPGSLDERVLIGDDALNTNDEMRVIRSVKRCFACQGNACKTQQKNNGRSFPWCNGDGKILIGDNEIIQPSQVAYFIVKGALQRALQIIEELWNINIKNSQLTLAPINLGCGANFNLEQRKIILDIAKELGFTNVKIQNIVDEPILAGFAFSRFETEKEGRSVIFDFGGGTLDVAVVDVDRANKNQPRVTVLATAGDNWLGGDDIDALVYDEFLQQIQTAFPNVPNLLESSFETLDQVNLLKMARNAKERLSSSDLFQDSLLLEKLGPVTLSLGREHFEDLLEESGIIGKSHEAMLRALKIAYALDVAKEKNLLDVPKVRGLELNQASDQVDQVVLVGGVTKIPYVRDGIVHLFGKHKVIEEKIIEPISAVVIGAAYPREVEHFSISSPPYGFYLQYKNTGEGVEIERLPLIQPFDNLDFFGNVYKNSIPSHSVSVRLLDDYKNVKLFGYRVGTSEEEEIRDINFFGPGNCHFHVCLNGELKFIDGDMKPKNLGIHPYTHPLQDNIREQRDIRYDEESKYDKTLEEDRRSIYSEN